MKHALTLVLASPLLLAACDAQPTRSQLAATPAGETSAGATSAAPTASPASPASKVSPAPAAQASSAVPASAVKPVALPAVGEVLRLAGDESITVTGELRKGVLMYRSGKHVVDSPLPVGYPRPTAPGTIELKHYPSIRRAEYGARVNADGTPADEQLVKAEGSGMENRGRDGFWPLFRHIQRRDIAMTAPVEMDWRGASVSDANAMQDAKWTMSFLYREPKQGADGTDPKDERVLVVDTKPAMMLSVGLAGRANDRTINAGAAKLREYLAANPQWKAVGDMRGLFYNDPTYSEQRAWAEIQVEVVPAQ